MGVVVYEVLGVIVLYSLHGVFGELYVPNHDVALSVNHSAWTKNKPHMNSSNVATHEASIFGSRLEAFWLPAFHPHASRHKLSNLNLSLVGHHHQIPHCSVLWVFGWWILACHFEWVQWWFLWPVSDRLYVHSKQWSGTLRYVQSRTWLALGYELLHLGPLFLTPWTKWNSEGSSTCTHGLCADFDPHPLDFIDFSLQWQSLWKKGRVDLHRSDYNAWQCSFALYFAFLYNMLLTQPFQPVGISNLFAHLCTLYTRPMCLLRRATSAPRLFRSGGGETAVMDILRPLGYPLQPGHLKNFLESKMSKPKDAIFR